MSLDVLEIPVIERLILGEVIQVQELRDALVEFWEKNNASSLCGNCPVQAISAVGCCGGCVYHDVTKGCTLRNIACLSYTCSSLENRLKQQGVWESYAWFREMLNGGLRGHDGFFNVRRLPDDARLQLLHRKTPRNSSSFEIAVFDEVEGKKPPGAEELQRKRKPIEDKIGASGIRCRVDRMMYKRIKEKYPDSPVYVDVEQVERQREIDRILESKFGQS